MIFLFTGEETFFIDRKIKIRKESFSQKYGALNIYDFSEWNFDLNQIQQTLMWWGLFDDKKLIIIRWIPKDSFSKVPSSLIEKTFDFVEKNIDSFNEDDVIVFVSYKPDRRTKAYKFLSKHSKIKLEEYKLLNERSLVAHLQKEFNIDSKLASYVVSIAWTNLLNIHNELSKILKISDTITKNLVDKYVNKNIEQDSFALLDNINNSWKSIKILENLQNNSEDFFKILWLLYWNIKNTILILEQKDMWLSSKEISSKIGVHPFVTMKVLKSHENKKPFILLFDKLLNLDFQIKSWTLDWSLAYIYLKKIFLEIK